MTSSTLSTTPISVALVKPGDVVVYDHVLYRADRFVKYPKRLPGGGVLMANAAHEFGGWEPEPTALPFANPGSGVDLVTGGAL